MKQTTVEEILERTEDKVLLEMINKDKEEHAKKLNEMQSQMADQTKLISTLSEENAKSESRHAEMVKIEQ